MNNPSDNIAAAAALGRIAEIKQFGLEEDYMHLSNMDAVKRINADAKAKTGVDLLYSKKKLTFDELDRYEDYLEEVVNQNLKQRFSDSFLADEIALLNSVNDFSLTEFRTIKIEVKSIMPAVKQVFKTIGISAPGILPILKNPIRVQREGPDELGDFYITSKFNLRSKTVVALFHMTLGELNISSTMTTFSEQFKKAVKVSSDNEASVVTCFLFNESSGHNEEPAKLLLSAIVKYGKDITINHTTKKFFAKGISSSLLIQKGDEVKFQDDLLSNKGVASFGMRETLTGYEYTNLYIIAQDRLVRDISRNQFL